MTTSIRTIRATGALLTASLTIAGSLLAATPAAADQVWIQSVQRADSNAACPTDGEPATEGGWLVSAWSPSWEQWPNGGMGGWTCTRSITWGLSTPAPALPAPPQDVDPEEPEDPGDSEDPGDPPVDTCLVFIAGSLWINIAPNTPVALPANVLYQDAGCTGSAAQLNGSGYIVSASSDAAAADLCGSGYIVSDVPGNADATLRYCIPA